MLYLKRKIAEAIISKGLKERDLGLEELERKHKDPEEALFNDSSYFLGRGEDGSHLVVRQAFRTTRGHEYWLSFHLPGLGTYELKDLDAVEGDGFSLGSLGYSCLEAGKRWAITYKGPVQREGTSQQVELNLEFEGLRPMVNFKNITLPSEVGAVLAKERWNKSFFNHLKEIKKVHLEQIGQITGTISIEGKEIQVKWRSLRDHSWGTRSWETWKRHVWLGGVLDNGEGFNLSMITYDFMGQLSAGYMSNGDQLIYLSGLPSMESFASNPHLPAETSIDFNSRDGKLHQLKVKTTHQFDFMMDGAYFIREGMGDFTLDGVPGMGVAEFGLNPRYYDQIPS